MYAGCISALPTRGILDTELHTIHLPNSANHSKFNINRTSTSLIKDLESRVRKSTENHEKKMANTLASMN